MFTKIEECIIELYNIGVVKFGDFTLKSGMQSPVYFDLRIIISYPKLMETVAELMWEARPCKNYELVCGVAYTGLPIATVISTKQDIPMLICRKESKGYGTKKLVEGNFKDGQSCLMIEDVIVSGSSVYETIRTLKELELDVKDAVVFLDREQGGLTNLVSMDINVVSVISMSKMMSILLEHGCVTKEISDSVLEFVKLNVATSIVSKQKTTCNIGTGVMDRKKCPIESRIARTNQPLTKKLLEIIIVKKSNLCVAADVTSSDNLLSLAEKVGPYICLLKTHIDILTDFNRDTIEKLKEIATKHNFLLFEDRKFGDIGNTVANQYMGGTYNIVDWADLVTAHGLPGDGIIKGLMSCTSGQPRGCVLVSEMSSTGALTTQEYVNGCSKIAKENEDFVVGFVAQSSISDDPRFVVFMPGVQYNNKGDNLGQQYNTPQVAIKDKGADIIIVGRGITLAEDQVAAAIMYKEDAFNAYLERISE